MTSHILWSEEETSYLTKHYKLAGPIQCARILGKPVRSTIGKAIRLGLHTPTPRDGLHIEEQRKQIIQMASRPEGVRAIEFTGWNNRAAPLMARMFTHGELFKVEISYRNVKYFANKNDADKLTAKLYKSPPVTIAKQNRAWWPADAEPIITEHTKITIAPSPKQRFHTNTHEE